MRALIEAFTAPGETVLDSFCGSGTTLVEALATKGKRDRSRSQPRWRRLSAASRSRLADTDALRQAFEHLQAAVADEINALYAGDGEESARALLPDHRAARLRFRHHGQGCRHDRGRPLHPRNLTAAALLWHGIQTIPCDPVTRDLLRFSFTAAVAQFPKIRT